MVIKTGKNAIFGWAESYWSVIDGNRTKVTLSLSKIMLQMATDSSNFMLPYKANEIRLPSRIDIYPSPK